MLPFDIYQCPQQHCQAPYTHWPVGPAIIQHGPSTVLARLWRAAPNASGVFVPGQWRRSDRKRFAEATTGMVKVHTAVQLQDATNTSAEVQQSRSTNWTYVVGVGRVFIWKLFKFAWLNSKLTYLLPRFHFQNVRLVVKHRPWQLRPARFVLRG